MSVGSLISNTYLLYFSQPASDRFLFKAVKGKPIRSVVEIGVGDGLRTERLLEVLAWQPDNLPLRYTAIDLFEARPKSQAGMTLKQAFSKIRREGVKVQLVPGDAYSALLRTANQLTETDLLVISADQDAAALEHALIYLPRMLHPQSLIYQEYPDAKSKGMLYRQLTLADIQRQAAAANKNLRRAA